MPQTIMVSCSSRGAQQKLVVNGSIAYIGLSQCIAASGVDCYCVSCDALSKQVSIDPFEPSLNANTSYSNPALPYGAPPRLDTAGHSSSILNPSFSFEKELPYMTYGNTTNNGSYTTHSAYGSMPAFSRSSATSFDPFSTWSGQDLSMNFLGANQRYYSNRDDMRASQPYSSQRLTTSIDPRRQYRPRPKDRGRRRQPPPKQNIAVPSDAEVIASLDCNTFLEALEILSMKLKNGNPLSETQKESLANLLEMTFPQMEFCLKVEYLLRNLTSTLQTNGIPTDYVVRWFGRIQSHSPEEAPLEDSAYQSLIPFSDKSLEPPRKRQRTTRDPSHPKLYQCTYIASNGSHCLQESSNFTDWKRHEETHRPQRRWECLIQGSQPNISCHVCHGNIVTQGQQSILPHTTCFGSNPRRGHVFPRKDKLVHHVKTIHDLSPDLDDWHYPVHSDWKTQCGFCGDTFADWDLRCEHVGRHFTTGKRMIPDWRDPWPSEDASDAPYEDDDDDANNDDDHMNDDNMDDRNDDDDADGEDVPDGDLDVGRQNDGGGHSHQYHTPNNDQDGNRGQQDGSSHKYCSSQGNHQSKQAQELGHRPQTQVNHQSLSIRPSQRIRGPGGNDDIFKSIGDLGYGSFGTVDEVEHTPTKRHFARKTIRIVHQRSLPALVQARREVAALRSLKHVHIVNLAASYTFENHFSIILSPVAEWNLSEYMHNDVSAVSIRLKNLSRWFLCLASAVKYMHEQSCQHLDIKPSNILIARDHVLLSDFGGAILSKGSGSSNVMSNGYAVTPMYCAPEILDRRGLSFVAGASDIYSLGCVFLEMATVIHRQSLPAFEKFRAFGSSNATYHQNPKKSLLWIQHLWEIDGSLGLPLKEGLHIIRNMLSHDWTKRPTARGIEESLQLWHLQLEHESTNKNYLIVAQTKAFFDPLDVVRHWLQNCSKSHTTCTSSVEDFVPSRILNVGKNGDSIRLESSDHSSPYVALSYCWGTTSTLTTTSQTLGKMLESIPVSSLPNTFLNAVRITRALGFHYLWIDALCIVQDSPEDWTTQVAQMHKIYAHSILTICVASDVIDTTIAKPKLLGTKPDIDSSGSPCSTCVNDFRAFKPLVDDTATTMLLDSPWSKRAWTLQERILSPRILYYSSTRLAWECDGERSTLDQVGRIRSNLKLLGIGKNTLPDKQKPDTSYPLMRSFRKTWRDIVREYSKRHLTFGKDKLPALAGVAYEIAAMSCQTYVAGLWKEDIINDLLWCRDFPTVPLPRPPYRAPSWSWASIDSPVVWSKSLSYPVMQNAQVLDCQTKVISKVAPLAGVSDGYLKIRGLMRKILVVCSRPEEVLDRQTLKPLAFAQWDAFDARPVTSTDPRLKGAQVEELCCLQILTEAGLLLRRVDDLEAQEFERVGVYWNQTNDGSKPGFSTLR